MGLGVPRPCSGDLLRVWLVVHAGAADRPGLCAVLRGVRDLPRAARQLLCRGCRVPGRHQQVRWRGGKTKSDGMEKVQL